MEEKTGIELIAEERERQIVEEGYDKEHDEIHPSEVFGEAAIAYIAADVNPDFAKDIWPWEEEYWKPKTRLRNLVRAGALIAAAIDRQIELDKQEKEDEEEI